MKRKKVYALGDGDRVQSAIDRALLSGDLQAVSEISRSLTHAMKVIAASAEGRDGWVVIFVGGDDILLEIADDAYDEDEIRRLMLWFSEITDGTMSFGVGTTVEEAYVNLRRAKSNGLGTLISAEPQGDEADAPRLGETLEMVLNDLGRGPR